MTDKPGKIALLKYRSYGSGMELFRAYIEQRKADESLNKEKLEQLISRLTPGAGLGISRQDSEEITTEMLRLQILNELDPIIKDLLKFCTMNIHADDQLPQLRSALRIGKGNAPSDSVNAERRKLIEQSWIQAYLEMQDTGKYKSESVIKRAVATTHHVSISTALSAWTNLKVTFPRQAQWAKEIADRALANKASIAKKRAKIAALITKWISLTDDERGSEQGALIKLEIERNTADDLKPKTKQNSADEPRATNKIIAEKQAAITKKRPAPKEKIKPKESSKITYGSKRSTK